MPVVALLKKKEKVQKAGTGFPGHNLYKTVAPRGFQEGKKENRPPIKGRGIMPESRDVYLKHNRDRN